jgi:hypothetical protein
MEIDYEGEIDIHDLKAIFGDISETLQKPVLIEGIFPDTKKIQLTNKNEKVKITELLSDICKQMEGFHYQITDKAVLIQQDRFVKEKNYPLEIKMDMKQPENVLQAQFDYELMRMRVFTCNPIMENKWEIAYKKYNGVRLRDVMIDILGNCGIAWISLIPEEEKKELAELPPVVPELLTDMGMPFYYLEFRPIRSSSEGQQTPKIDKTQPVMEILDGRKMLKMESVFDPKKYAITLSIENTSGEELFFKDARNSLMVEEAFQDKDSQSGILTARMLYPPEKDVQFKDFSLKSKEKKEFVIRLKEGRCKREYAELMYEMDSEAKSKINVVPFQDVTIEDYDFFRPIAYFYDKVGKKYKSRGYESDMKRE